MLGIGREPRAAGAAPDAPSLIFDWTALEVAAECLRQGYGSWPANFGLPVVVVSSEKAESEIPETRRSLYEELLSSGCMQVESIMAGSRAAAFLRQTPSDVWRRPSYSRRRNWGGALRRPLPLAEKAGSAH